MNLEKYHPMKPSIILKRNGLNPKEYNIVKNIPGELLVVHKVTSVPVWFVF